MVRWLKKKKRKLNEIIINSTYSGEAGNLVSKALGLNDSDFLSDTLVGVEIKSKTVVVFLNDDPRGLLHSFGANATCNLENEVK